MTTLHKIRVPHTSILMCGHRAKLDRFPVPTPNARVPHPFAASPRKGGMNQANPTVFAVASEIGPGFSPDIPGQQKKPRFSPRDMLSSPNHTVLIEAAA